MKRQNKYFLKILIIAVCLVIIPLYMTTPFNISHLCFIPGLGSVLTNNKGITHSIENTVYFEESEYTHRINAGYIMKNRIYFETFVYKTENGITYELQSRVDYQVYYNNIKCGNYVKSYGNNISVSYELPKILRYEPMIISLYDGENYLTDIALHPIARSEKLTAPRPYCTIDDVMLFANVQRNGDLTEVYISAILPRNALRGFVDNRRLGFAESEVLIIDSRGNEYHNNANFENEEEMLLRQWHYFTFNLPENITEFTIVIPSIKYRIKKGNRQELVNIGPWKIQITKILV